MASTANLVWTVKPTFRDLGGRFKSGSDRSKKRWHDEMKFEARRFVSMAKDEAPGSPEGSVGRGIRFRTFFRGNSFGFTVTPGRIGRYHLEGTGIYGPKGRLIRPINARALRFEKEGEVLFRMWVRGIRPNPFFGRAFRRWLPGWRKIGRRMSTRWARELGGKIRTYG